MTNGKRRPARLRKQRGLAAIEFALVFTVLFILLYGLTTLGAVLYTQQAVSRAAEEGARAVMMLTPQPTSGDTRVKDAVYDALAGSLIVPPSVGSSLSARRSWIVGKVTVNVDRGSPSGGIAQVAVSVSYPYNDSSRILPAIPLVDSAWVPQQLRSRTTAPLKSS
ncbi:TadE/TadG family type IV pilus assembly protein [Variovorax sp. Varisp41]|uniref:TadE/TadG family type IV pilus assembly protein n=1 Tax=unclassified Variovorax TaxID=663243 RepID=UPI0039B454A6